MDKWAVDGHLWAYLDDIFLEVQSPAVREEVVEFLATEEIVAKYGLRVNPSKCKFVEGATVRETGTEILGVLHRGA